MAGEREILLAIFLKHDQGKNLGKINAHLDETGFWSFHRRASRSFRGT